MGCARVEGVEGEDEVEGEECAICSKLVNPQVTNSADESMDKEEQMRRSIYQSKTATANDPCACLQYPLRDGSTGAPHPFVIIHGAPLCGCAGSLKSLAVCACILTAYSATSALCTTTLSNGWKTCVMNIIPFTSNKKIESTAITTL